MSSCSIAAAPSKRCGGGFSPSHGAEVGWGQWLCVVLIALGTQRNCLGQKIFIGAFVLLKHERILITNTLLDLYLYFFFSLLGTLLLHVHPGRGMPAACCSVWLHKDMKVISEPPWPRAVLMLCQNRCSSSVSVRWDLKVQVSLISVPNA